MRRRLVASLLLGPSLLLLVLAVVDARQARAVTYVSGLRAGAPRLDVPADYDRPVTLAVVAVLVLCVAVASLVRRGPE